jgi:hypothetical protein
MAKTQQVFETSEARAIKAHLEASALRKQYDTAQKAEEEAAKSAAFPVPVDYNMAQKERFKQALDNFKHFEAQAALKIQQEKDALQAHLAQLDEEIKKANREQGTPEEKTQEGEGGNMEQDGEEQPAAGAAAAAATTPQPDLAKPLPPQPLTPGSPFKRGKTEGNNKENINPMGTTPAEAEQAARDVRANVASLRAEARSRSPGARARDVRAAFDEVDVP